MLEIICYLMPSFISLNIHNSINKKTDLYKSVIYFGIYCVINNLLTMTIFYAMNLHNVVVMNFNVLQFSIKYLFGAMIFSMITPYIIKFVTSNIEIKVEAKKIEKSNK